MIVVRFFLNINLRLCSFFPSPFCFFFFFLSGEGCRVKGSTDPRTHTFFYLSSFSVCFVQVHVIILPGG